MSSKDNLENLVRSGGLNKEPPDRKECEGLLRSAIDRLTQPTARHCLSSAASTWPTTPPMLWR